MLKGEKIPEFIEILLFLFAALFVVYIIPAPLNRIIFLAVLPLAWYSKRDYFWIAFFFIMLEHPSGLFSGGQREDAYRLPLYSLAPGFSFSIQELYFILLLIKSLVNERIKRTYIPTFLNKELKLLLWLFIALVLISPAMGMNFNVMINIMRLSVSLSLFYSFIRLVNKEDDFLRFLKLLFPFAFIALSLQIYFLITGQQLIATFIPEDSDLNWIYGIQESARWVRPIVMAHAVLITFSGSLIYLLLNRQGISKQYLILINLSSFLVIFMSGTRSWVLAFSIGYLMFFLISGFRIPKLLTRTGFAIIVFFLVAPAIPVVNKQIKNSWNRIATLEEVIEGDITGGGTINRYDQKAPNVMKGFTSSSILLGAGFSNHFNQYRDGHVGYHNILLNTGIIGTIIFIYVILRALLYPFRMGNKRSSYQKAISRVGIITLIILLFINIGTQTIGFTPDGVNRVILMAFSIVTIDKCVRMSYS